MTLVSIKNLTVRFGDITAINGISFDIEPGKCVALVGESGSGKSVTGRSLLGLVGRNAEVTADELSFKGRDLRSLSDAEWRAIRGTEIGLVLQDALVSLDPLMRVGRQVTESIRAHTSVVRSALAAKAIRLLEDAGVPDAQLRAKQYPHELSGGLRQRALIASAVAAGPRLLIADEPTTALDVTVQAQVLALLDRLRAEGTGLLLISHDLAVVSALADEIIVLREGEVVEQGNVTQVLASPRATYTRELIAAIPSQRSRGQRLSIASTPLAESDPPVKTGSDERRSEPVIQAVGLKKAYATAGATTVALDDVSFTLGRGTTLGIVGESGSGKSTAASVVLGLTKPDAGEVLLDGAPWSVLPERRRRSERHRIQLISQDPLGSFDPRANVESILCEALATVGTPRNERRERAALLLKQVGLDTAHLGRHPLELSGGQRQRVAISRALATDPEVIVCDEAVSALDVSIQAQVLDLLVDLQNQLGVSLLFISHDLGVIRHIADEVLVMRRGRVVEAGVTESVFTNPGHEYTRELIAAIPTLHTRPRVAAAQPATKESIILA